MALHSAESVSSEHTENGEWTAGWTLGITLVYLAKTDPYVREPERSEGVSKDKGRPLRKMPMLRGALLRSAPQHEVGVRAVALLEGGDVERAGSGGYSAAVARAQGTTSC